MFSPGVQFTDNRMTININEVSHLYSTVLYQAARICKKASDRNITTYREMLASLEKVERVMYMLAPPDRRMDDVCSSQQIGPNT